MAPTKNQYAFLMLDVELPEELQQVQDKLYVHDIYDNEEHDYGLELEPHVTIYSCMDNDVNIQELLESLPDPKEFDLFVTDNSLSAFTDMEGKDYDVLKIDIRSKLLTELHNKLAEKYVSHSEFKEYHPHVTLAYMKKGTTDKYIHKFSSAGWIPYHTRYRFSWSDKDQKKHSILYNR